ncbi:MAG: hypothetical protein P1U34_09060 [Coxiellaceae bacterium]|nr:hypothetical protein [Coxiellaceae bacterium]
MYDEESEEEEKCETTEQKAIAAYQTAIETDPMITRTDERYGRILCMQYRDVPPRSPVTTRPFDDDQFPIVGSQYFISRIDATEHYTSSLEGKTKKYLRDGLLAWVDAFNDESVDPFVEDMNKIQCHNYFVHALQNGFDDIVRAAFARALMKNNQAAFGFMQGLNDMPHHKMDLLNTIEVGVSGFDAAEIQAIQSRKVLLEQNARIQAARLRDMPDNAFDNAIDAKVGARKTAEVAFVKVNDLNVEFSAMLTARKPADEVVQWLKDHKAAICSSYETFTYLYRVFAKDKYSYRGEAGTSIETEFGRYSEEYHFKEETERRAQESSRHRLMPAPSAPPLADGAAGGVDYPGPSAGAAAGPT